MSEMNLATSKLHLTAWLIWILLVADAFDIKELLSLIMLSFESNKFNSNLKSDLKSFSRISLILLTTKSTYYLGLNDLFCISLFQNCWDYFSVNRSFVYVYKTVCIIFISLSSDICFTIGYGLLSTLNEFI